MSFLLRNFDQIAALGAWIVLWMLGGWWIARRAFNLQSDEQVMVGLAVGLVMEDLLVNFLAPFMSFPLACWLGAGLVFMVGMVMILPDGWRSLFSIRPAQHSVRVEPGQWVVLLLLIALFTAIGRGMAIFDDYAHLPTVSLMATGDIPPHFSLDPSVPYGYHYFLLLFAAQVVQLGQLFPWVALDFSRGLSLGLAVVLMGIWTRRLTRNHMAGILGGAFLILASATRWLLLLLPSNFLDSVSQTVQMIGSGASSGASLSAALFRPWAMDGGGPIPFPFAFASGILNPGVVTVHGATGVMNYVVLLALLLTFNRWRNWQGGLVTVFLVASTGLLGETGLALGLVAWCLISLGYIITHKNFRLPRPLWTWWVVVLAGNLLAVLEGGAWTDIIHSLLDKLVGVEAQASYQTIGFQLVWPPALVSAHLGVLNLVNFRQLIVAVCEIGPVLLALPLVFMWGVKAYRSGRWYEASFILSGLLTLGMLFVQFSGSTGVRNTSRLYSFTNLCVLYAVPLVWIWVRQRITLLKYLAGTVLGITMLGGIVLFGIELVAIPRPVESYFLNELDARMFKNYWNRLEPGALIFDPTPSRAPAVFGRSTNSSYTWFEDKPAWKTLVKDPDPAAISQAGFDYIYLGNIYWQDLDPKTRLRFQNPCVLVVQQYENAMRETRALYDIRACR